MAAINIFVLYVHIILWQCWRFLETFITAGGIFELFVFACEFGVYIHVLCQNICTCMQVLRERLGVHCVLGLTATATSVTVNDVIEHFGFEQKNVITGGAILPRHLNITVSCKKNKDRVSRHLVWYYLYNVIKIIVVVHVKLMLAII